MQITIQQTKGNVTITTTIISPDIQSTQRTISSELLKILKQSVAENIIDVYVDDAPIIRTTSSQLQEKLTELITQHFVFAEYNKKLLYNTGELYDEHKIINQINDHWKENNIKCRAAECNPTGKRLYWLKSDSRYSFRTIDDAYQYLKEREIIKCGLSTFRCKEYYTAYLTTERPKTIHEQVEQELKKYAQI